MLKRQQNRKGSNKTGKTKSEKLLFLLCVCICCRYLVYGKHEVLVQQSIYVQDWFKLLIYFQCVSNILHFYSTFLTIAGFDTTSMYG